MKMPGELMLIKTNKCHRTCSSLLMLDKKVNAVLTCFFSSVTNTSPVFVTTLTNSLNVNRVHPSLPSTHIFQKQDKSKLHNNTFYHQHPCPHPPLHVTARHRV